jgi:hypothetical protein
VWLSKAETFFQKAGMEMESPLIVHIFTRDLDLFAILYLDALDYAISHDVHNFSIVTETYL